MPDDEPRFGAEDVIAIASRLNADNTSFVVGGQATNLWAWYYRGRSPELQFEEPLTSLGIDYFGSSASPRISPPPSVDVFCAPMPTRSTRPAPRS